MIEISVDGQGEIIGKQFCTNPTAYLDLWAFMDFAIDESLGNRFVQALVSNGGTLAMSWIHFLGLSQLSDQSQAMRIAALLQRIAPQIFFIEVVPKNVIERENSILQTGNVIAPHADDKFLKAFLLHRRQSVNPLSITEFLRDFQQEKVVEMCQSFMAELKEVVESSRQRARQNPTLGARIREVPLGPHIQHATRYIDVEAGRYLVRDKINMSSQDWRDYFHMIIPLAYCDVLLLDRTWASKAQEIVRRLQRAGHKAPMAQVFWKREMESFWAVLENVSVKATSV